MAVVAAARPTSPGAVQTSDVVFATTVGVALVAVSPPTAWFFVPLLALLAVARAYPNVEPSLPVYLAAGACVLALVVVVAIAPSAAVPIALASAAAAAAWHFRPAVPPVVQAKAGLVIALLLASILLVAALVTWPVTVALILIVCGIAVLAVRAPYLALGTAILLFGFEGSIK